MTTDDPLPPDTVDAVVRLTRLARQAVDDNEAAAYREERAARLAEFDYEARVREDEETATLVCHPTEWLDDEGTLRMDAVEDLDRAVEVQLSGAGDPDEWDAVAAHNREVAAAVREAHGDVHGDNAAEFAAFMSNHYARRVETAGAEEVARFRDDFFERNVWPTAAQEQALEESLELVFEAAGREPPTR